MATRSPALHRRLGLILVLAAGTTGCERDRAEATPKTPPPAAEAESAAETPPASSDDPPKSPGHALLDWLDPDAVAVVYSKMSREVDLETFATVFAVPPKLARMLRDIPAVDEGLDAILDPEDPRPSQWLSVDGVAAASRVSSGTYVLRTITRPAADVQALLERAKMRRDEIEGFTVLAPQGPFPWKVAFLTEQVVAFVPVKEIGTGLSPLTAGRDLPASEVETQLRTVLDDDPATVLEAYAAGPLLHLDLGQDLAQFAVRARPFERSGLDVEVQLVPLEDTSAAAKALGERDLSLETDAVAALAQKVAFTVEGAAVIGRLQATPPEVGTLSEG